ncbi:porin family protein [Cytophagaceae bacterium DM2B3-1]|uniref:Porin family protein n=1 Tax=Xanthocytophaga flava TaxID=3048013 RepID=A0ABT7CVR8_9BACT|nr:porin family protein [Xanthocytophaga flavus]MDJ1497828.1 porin family protein [Xanthocytophaga flavus]
MLKKLFLVSLFLGCIQLTQAQDKPPFFTFGPKAGVNFSTLVRDTRNFSADYRLGYNAGLFLRFNVGRLYIQPEGIFSTKGASITINQSVDPDVKSGKYELKLYNVDIPVLIGLTLIQNKLFNIRVFGGPMASYNLNGEGVKDFLKETGSVEEAYKKAILGYQAGLGLDLGSFTIDARYEGSFTETGDWDRVNLGKPKGGLYQLSLGLKIL